MFFFENWEEVSKAQIYEVSSNCHLTDHHETSRVLAVSQNVQSVKKEQALVWASQGNPFLPILLLWPILAFLKRRYLLPRSSITRITNQPTLAQTLPPPLHWLRLVQPAGLCRGLLKNAPKLAVP